VYRFVDLTVSFFFSVYSLSRDTLSVNFLKFLQYLFISISLLTGQFSDRSTAALSMSRSCSTSLQCISIYSSQCKDGGMGQRWMPRVFYFGHACHRFVYRFLYKKKIDFFSLMSYVLDWIHVPPRTVSCLLSVLWRTGTTHDAWYCQKIKNIARCLWEKSFPGVMRLGRETNVDV